MFSLNDFHKYKKEDKKISMVTAYDYFSAKLLEDAGVETLLVGDSLGMVIQGNNNTLNVTVEEMIYHAKAVKKGAPNSFIIVDMPYLSYHISIPDSVKNAGKIIQKTTCNAVKIEVNNLATLEHIRAIIAAQIPVVAHIGMTPQSFNIFGGFRVQGRDDKSRQHILELAKSLEEIGVVALVLECIPKAFAKTITDGINIATIGIGAGKNCDGQVLVFHDMLGFDPNNKIKFVKKFVNAHEYLVTGIKEYVKEVKNYTFPAEQNAH